MRTRKTIAVGLFILLLVPLMALAQFPQQGGGKKGKGGKGGFGNFNDPNQGGGGKKGKNKMGGMFNMDPAQMWDGMAQGKDVLTRNDLTNPGQQFFFDRIAQSVGSTNGLVTKQQFIGYMDQMRNGPGGPQGGQAPPAPPTAEQLSEWDKAAEEIFRRADANGDGKLNLDEMAQADPALPRQLQRWDTDKDGQIDLTEFKAFYHNRMQAQMRRITNNITFGPDGEEEDVPLKRPDVFRAGNAPKNLPAWFTQLDIDGDGQIGLYEWKKSGKSLAEFKVYDRNGDGFITMDEMVRYIAANTKTTDPGSASQLVQNDQGGGPAMMAFPPGKGGFPGMPGGGKGPKGGGKGRKGGGGN